MCVRAHVCVELLLTAGDDVGDREHELACLTVKGSESLVPHYLQVGHTARQLTQLREPPPCGYLLKREREREREERERESSASW